MPEEGSAFSYATLPAAPHCSPPPNVAEQDYDLGTNQQYKFSPDVSKIQFRIASAKEGYEQATQVGLLLYDFKQRHVGTVCMDRPQVHCALYTHEKFLNSQLVTVLFRLDLNKLPVGIAYAVIMIAANDLRDVPLVDFELFHQETDMSQPRRLGHRQVGNLTGPSATLGVLCRNGAWWDLHSLHVLTAWATSFEAFVSNHNNVEAFLLQPLLKVSIPKVHLITFWVAEGVNLAISDPSVLSRFVPGLHRGSSDPYYTIAYKAVKRTAPTMRKTLHPKWNLEEVGNIRDKVLASDAHKIMIRVWDEDRRSGDDFLGQAVLQAGQLWCLLPPGEVRTEVTMRLPLQTSPKIPAKHDVTGHVLLHVIVEDIGHEVNLGL